ncbi:MAG: PAS domain-containing protein [Roseococcus sp.]|nr:PAS domain-containing protein [Roseococcus sp.]
MHAPTPPSEVAFASSLRPARPLSRHIALLAGLLLAPALGLGVMTAIDQTRRIREGLETAFFYAGRAAAVAVVKEVETRVFLLGALAGSRSLDRGEGDREGFRAGSRAALEAFGGRILFLPGPEGAGESDAPGLLQQLAETALARGEPAFPLLPQPAGRPLPFVIVPIQRPQARLGALGIPIDPAVLDAALRLPELPAGSALFLLGPGGEVIARSSEAVLPGLSRWPEGQEAALRAAIGMGLVPVTLGSARLLIQAEPVERTGWTVVVAEPEASFAARWRAPALRYMAGAAAIVAAGLLVAGWFTRRLLAALPGRTESAVAVRTGRTPGFALRVAEFEAAEEAIRQAQAALRREVDRSRAVAAENSRLAREAENDRRLLRSVMESAPNPIFVKDRALRYVMVNEATARAIGRPAQEILGRGDADLLPGHVAERLTAQDQEVMALGGPMEFEDRLPSGSGGGTTIFLTTKSPWRHADGRLAGVVGIARDVTRRREAETRLRAAEDAMRRLARADSLTVMSVGIAHELNQPLTAAANYLAAALRWLDRAGGEGTEMAAARTAIAEAVAETQRAGAILRGLRDFIDRGVAGQSEVALAPLITETVGLLAAARGGEELPVALELPEAPVVVRADRLQLQQVLVNLLRNAIEATEGLPERGLAVQLSVQGGQARLSVLDRGPGLAPEVRARLFEPFVSTSAQGMGMGLSICRTIIEALGGRIAAEDRPGGGAAFVIQLPLARELP